MDHRDQVTLIALEVASGPRSPRWSGDRCRQCVRALLVAYLGLSAAACVGTSAKLNMVSLGMTKADVIHAIGRPDSVTAQNGVEYLIYHWANPKQLIADEETLDRYFVRLVNGRVDAYGEAGDLGTSGDLRNR
jgi:hypothetical protein